MEYQADIFAAEETRAQLDQLLEDSRLYKSSRGYKALMDFCSQLRGFAPFNSMLLHIQKPGITYAASAREWQERFQRQPKPDARPLLILWPFGPVALVYDVQDTEGAALPQDAFAFPTTGGITTERMTKMLVRIDRRNIKPALFDGGDGKAGSISVEYRAPQVKGSKGKKAKPNRYRLAINRNHDANTQFSTLVHELAHLYLGHLGEDRHLRIDGRAHVSHQQCELEAESVAYLVSKRQGVHCRSHTYLSNYVSQHTEVGDLDLYQVMKVAGHVELLLGLAR